MWRHAQEATMSKVLGPDLQILMDKRLTVHLNGGRKVTGISFLVKEKRQYMLVTTNDSRLRVMSLDTFSITTKFKGHVNRSRQLKASLSSDRKYIACGSDNGRVWAV